MGDTERGKDRKDIHGSHGHVRMVGLGVVMKNWLGYAKKRPCSNCPFRKDVHPFLATARMEGLMEAAELPFATFHCHKTLDYDHCDGEDDSPFAGRYASRCAGFMTLQHQISPEGFAPFAPDGFVPSTDVVYESPEAAVAAHRKANGEDDDNQ